MKYGEAVRIGPHIVGVGDATSSDLQALVEFSGLSPVVGYVDPPWGQGLLTNFRNRVPGTPRQEWGDFTWKFARSLNSLGCRFYVEMGVKWAEGLAVEMGKAGLAVLGMYEGTYYGKRPMKFLVVGESDPGGLVDLSGIDDNDSPLLVCANHPEEGPVCDPCCGKGLTAKAAHETGRPFIGMEFNPERAENTVVRLEKLNGSTRGQLEMYRRSTWLP